MSWRIEYIPWYRIAEEVLAGSIPLLEDKEIVNFVSHNHWLILPTSTEKDRKDSIIRSDANIYFDLSKKGKITVGFVCNTLESVRRMRNLLHGFHTTEKDRFIHQLRLLDDRYTTSIERKIKAYYFAQTPEYETDFEFTTNTINDELLTQAFNRIDKIMEESDTHKRITGKSWRTLAPTINIASVVIGRNPDEFREVLQQLKPAYQIALRIKTDKEITLIIAKRKQREQEARQKQFNEFIQKLKNDGVRGKDYRDAVAKWIKEHS
jgi:hypothetical protein